MDYICNGEPNHNGEERKNILEQSIFRIQHPVYHLLVLFLDVADLPKSLLKDNIDEAPNHNTLHSNFSPRRGVMCLVDD